MKMTLKYRKALSFCKESTCYIWRVATDFRQSCNRLCRKMRKSIVIYKKKRHFRIKCNIKVDLFLKIYNRLCVRLAVCVNVLGVKNTQSVFIKYNRFLAEQTVDELLKWFNFSWLKGTDETGLFDQKSSSQIKKNKGLSIDLFCY